MDFEANWLVDGIVQNGELSPKLKKKFSKLIFYFFKQFCCLTAAETTMDVPKRNRLDTLNFLLMFSCRIPFHHWTASFTSRPGELQTISFSCAIKCQWTSINRVRWKYITRWYEMFSYFIFVDRSGKITSENIKKSLNSFKVCASKTLSKSNSIFTLRFQQMDISTTFAV